MRSKKKTVGMKKRRKKNQQPKRSKKARGRKTIQPRKSKKAMAMIRYIMRWRLFPPPEFPYPTSSKGGTEKRKKKKVRFQDLPPESVHEDHAGELKIEPIPEIIGGNEGVLFLKLDRDAQAVLSCIIGEDLLLDRNWKYVQKEIITNDITEKGEDSQFFPILEALETSPNDHVLVIFDKNVDAYYLFFSLNPLRHIQNLAAKFITCVRWIKFGIQRINPPLVHFEAKEARKIGKEVSKEIVKERLTVERKRMRVICYVSLEAMKLRGQKLSSVEAKDLEGGYINNLMRKRPSEEDITMVQEGTGINKKRKYRGVKDVGVQVFSETTEHCSQVFSHDISNKSVQKSLDCIKSKKPIYRTYGSVLLISDACIQFLSFSLEEITIKDLCSDHVQGFNVKAQENENDNSEKFFRGNHFLGDHHVLPHKYYSKHNYTEIFDLSCFQRVSCIAWHPRYIDMVAIAYRNYVYEVKKVKFEDIDFLDESDNEDKATDDDSAESRDGSLIVKKEFDFDLDKDFCDLGNETVPNATYLGNTNFCLALCSDNYNLSSDTEKEHEEDIVVDTDSDYDIDSLDSNAIAKLLVRLSSEVIVEKEDATAGIASPDDVSALGGETEAGKALGGIKTAMLSEAVDGIDDLVDEYSEDDESVVAPTYVVSPKSVVATPFSVGAKSAEDGESVVAPTYVVSPKSVVGTPFSLGAKSAEGGDNALVGEGVEDGASVVASTFVVSPKSVMTTISARSVADLNWEGFDRVSVVCDDGYLDWACDMDDFSLEGEENPDDLEFPENWNILENLISDKESNSFRGSISNDKSKRIKGAISDDEDITEVAENLNECDTFEYWEDILFESFRSGCIPPPNSEYSDENSGISEEELFYEKDLKIDSTPDFDIIEWRLVKEPHPTRVIKCDCEISLLQYNPDYPTLLAGANKDGQIFMWDMNIYDVPVSVYIRYMSSKFSSEIVPWTYKPSPVAYVAIESCEMYSHRGQIFDMQWVPSNSRMLQDRSMNISGKVKSSLIVTASGDGTVGIFDLQMGHPLSKNMKHRRKHVSNVTPDIQPFTQYDRHMQPLQYVMATMNGEPIPVTAITVNNLRQWIVPGLQRTDYLNYASMKNALKKQRPMMHACITAGLSSGQVIGMFPDLEHYEKKRDLDDPHFYKDLYWVPHNESYIQYQCFKHEGPVLCLKRSHFADDVILSVSETSFCIWKEQSRLYKERKENMPWLKSWFNEEVHGPPLHNRILPVCWRRTFISNDYYTTGEWSPLCSSQFFLLMSNGSIEVYDVNVREEGPLSTVYVGPNMIHHVLPLMCSNKCDDLAFIEDEVLFYVKMPEYCKTKNIAQFKDLQKFVNHEAWRRGLYYGWCEKFNQEHQEYVRERVLEAHRLFGDSRYGRVKGVYKYIRLMRAKAEKAIQAKKAFSHFYEDGFPGGWWDEIKKRGIYGVLARKKKLMRWFEWRDIIFDIALRDTILFKKIYEPTRVAFKPFERTHENWIDVMLKNASKVHLKKYWVIRHEQTHAYDESYFEEPHEDMPAAQNVDLKSDKYPFTALKRQREYGIIFEFVDYYEAEKIRDLGRIKERKGRLKFGAIEVLVAKTIFSRYLSKLHALKMTHAIPKLTHECNLPGANSPLNKVWDMWTLFQVIDKDPLLKTANLPPRVRGKKSAVDYANFYFQ